MRSDEFADNDSPNCCLRASLMIAFFGMWFSSRHVDQLFDIQIWKPAMRPPGHLHSSCSSIASGVIPLLAAYAK